MTIQNALNEDALSEDFDLTVQETQVGQTSIVSVSLLLYV